MNKEEIISRIGESDCIYGFINGFRYARYIYEDDDGNITTTPTLPRLLKIPINEVTITDSELITNQSAKQVNYSFSDYGITWGFTIEDIENRTLEQAEEDWHERLKQMFNHLLDTKKIFVFPEGGLL